SAGFILAAQFNGRFLRRRTPLQLLRTTTLCFMAGTLLLPVIALLRTDSLWRLMLPLFFCMASLALVVPNSSACALAGQGHQAGVASALAGTVPAATAGVRWGVVGALHDGTAVPMPASRAVCGVGSAGMALMAGRVGSVEFGVR